MFKYHTISCTVHCIKLHYDVFGIISCYVVSYYSILNPTIVWHIILYHIIWHWYICPEKLSVCAKKVALDVLAKIQQSINFCVQTKGESWLCGCPSNSQTTSTCGYLWKFTETGILMDDMIIYGLHGNLKVKPSTIDDFPFYRSTTVTRAREEVCIRWRWICFDLLNA